MAQSLDSIECSVQPLDMSFHPTMDIVAAGLVDGTVELHDFSTLIMKEQAQPTKNNTKMSTSDDDDNDEFDTILSSIPVHSDEKPKRSIPFESTDTTTSNKSSSSSCRATMFDNCGGSKLYTAGNSGSFTCLDTERASSFRTSDDSILWKVDNASPNGINTLYQLNEQATAGPLVITGDDEGVVRLWDCRQIGSSATTTKQSAFDGLLDLPKGCLASFKENSDYITGFDTDQDGNTLLASSADGTLSVFDIRMSRKQGTTSSWRKSTVEKASGKSNPAAEGTKFKFLRKSDDQEDELLSICRIKGEKKVVCGTQGGVLAIWSWNTWGDISDRFPGHPQSIDALLKVDEQTLLTGSSDGLIRAVQIHPNKLLGIIGDHHDGFPIEKLEFSAFRKALGSLSHDTMIRLWDASILQDNDDNDDDGIKDDDDDDDDDNNMKVVDDADREAEDSMDSDSDTDSDTKETKMFKSANEEFFEDL